jgi:IclR family transcriptional regulator, acetate operon repressor
VSGNSNEPGRTVTSKTVAILSAFTVGGPLTLTELAHQTNIPVSTVYRHVRELARVQALERDADHRYSPSPGLRSLIGGDATATLRGRAPLVVDDLATALRSTVRLGVLDGMEIAYITKQPGSTPTTSFSKAARVPAHATALGKAVLAYTPATIRQVISCQLTRYTPQTLTTVGELIDALHRIRVRGFATVDRELDPSACAVGVPVFGTGGAAIAAIDVQVDNLEHSALEAVLPALITAARCLGREIAPPGPTSARPTHVPPDNDLCECTEPDRAGPHGQAAPAIYVRRPCCRPMLPGRPA